MGEGGRSNKWTLQWLKWPTSPKKFTTCPFVFYSLDENEAYGPVVILGWIY